MGGDYRELVAWEKAFKLSLAIYRETSKFPMEEKYGLVSQIRRAGVSIPSNIAEGQGRHSKGEFIHYLFIALGSLKEVETQILISDALGYFKPNQAAKLMTMAADVGRLINGLSKTLRITANRYPLTTTHYRLPTADCQRPRHMMGKYRR
jgi:four helix bundle protein